MALYYISSNKYSLHERQSKSGKMYDVIFNVTTIDGERKQKWLRGYKTKTLAKEAYLAFIQQYCELIRHAPRIKKDEKKESLLVGDLIRQYLASLGNQNKQSVIYDKNNIFRLFVLPKYDNAPITKLTKEELFLWQDELWAMKNKKTGEYFSYAYLIKIRSQFGTFLSWVEQRYNYKNNLVDVPKPKRRQARTEMKFWDKETFSKFIASVDNEMYHALFTFMFYTGRRKGELFALFKTDVKEDKITFDKSVNRRTFGMETWEITSTKADKSATVPICKTVQEEIKRYNPPTKGKFYFGGEKPLPPTTVERVFKKYIALADVPPIRIHDLRHSFVSLAISLGADFTIVASLISDTPEQITRTYAHLYTGALQNVIDKIG